VRASLFVLSLAAVAAAPVAAQSVSTQGTAARKEIIYVEPTDDDYAGMILAATAWAKSTVSKSLGVLQREEAAPAWKRGVDAAAKAHGLKTIEMNDFTMVCYTRQATRSTPASRVCSMKGADAVLQFNTLRVSGDSGAMVTSVTRVPKNGSRTETTHYCVMFGRKQGADWESVRSSLVPDPDRCF
jgi:hypothetical protein